MIPCAINVSSICEALIKVIGSHLRSWFAILPKILAGGRDLGIILLSFYECRFNGGDTMRWWGHSGYMLKNLFELISLKGSGNVKALGASTHAQVQALALTPTTSTSTHAQSTGWNLHYRIFCYEPPVTNNGSWIWNPIFISWCSQNAIHYLIL